MSSAPPSAIDLSNTYGTMFLCAFLSAALWGTTCTQTFTYFIGYPKDRSWIKCMVTWLWLMDTTHQALIIKSMYGVFVSRFGDVTSLAFVPKDLIAEIVFTVLVSSTTQFFFTYRIWRFSGKKWIFPIVAIPLIVSQFVLQTYYMSVILRNNTLDVLKKGNPLTITYNTMAAATDIALSGCMIYLLRAERNGLNSSDQLVGKLMIFSFNSGLWTALVALATVITLVSIPLPDLVYPAVYTILCPLYCNTVLANLNSRKFLREWALNQSSTPSHGAGGNIALETFSRSGGARVPQNMITIQVDTTKAIDNESLQEIHDQKGISDPSF